jgi:hypothetical protein
MATARFDVGAAPLDPRVINGFYPPVVRGLEGYYKLEPSALQVVSGVSQLINLANPLLPALVTGTPGQEADGLTLTPRANFLSTQILPTASQTYMFVGKAMTTGSAVADKAFMMGNFSRAPSPNRGDSLCFNGLPSGQVSPQGILQAPASTSVDGGATVGIASSSLNVLDVLAWHCYAAVVTAPMVVNGVVTVPATVQVFDLTTGQAGPLVNLLATGQRVIGQPILIGSAYANDFLGACRGRRALKAAVAWTLTELNTMYAFWKAELAAAANPVTI